MPEMQIQCPECGLWFAPDGTGGLFPHLLEHHPFSGMATQVDEYLLEEILA